MDFSKYKLSDIGELPDNEEDQIKYVESLTEATLKKLWLSSEDYKWIPLSHLSNAPNAMRYRSIKK